MDHVASAPALIESLPQPPKLSRLTPLRLSPPVAARDSHARSFDPHVHRPAAACPTGCSRCTSSPTTCGGAGTPTRSPCSAASTRTCSRRSTTARSGCSARPSQARFEELATDDGFLAHMDRVAEALDHYLERPDLVRRRPSTATPTRGSPTSPPSSASTRASRSTPAASACWPAITSRAPATSACRSSASA